MINHADFKVRLLSTALIMSASLIPMTGMADPAAHTSWCLTGDATYTILQQPQRDYCPYFAGGAAIGTYFAQEHATWLTTMSQNGWSQKAARELACSSDPLENAYAVGLIMACQCHNQGAADEVINNPETVLRVMREFANCD